MIQIKKISNVEEKQSYIKIIASLEEIIFSPNNYDSNELLSFFKLDSFTLYIVVLKNEVIGYALVNDLIDLLEIYKIAVIDKYRKLHYGSKILDLIKQENKKIIIEVSDRDNTCQFYLKNDFKIIFTRHKYYYDGSNAIIMEYKKNNC